MCRPTHLPFVDIILVKHSQQTINYKEAVGLEVDLFSQDCLFICSHKWHSILESDGAVPLCPAALVFQSLAFRWTGLEVFTRRCCTSLHVSSRLQKTRTHLIEPEPLTLTYSISGCHSFFYTGLLGWFSSIIPTYFESLIGQVSDEFSNENIDIKSSLRPLVDCRTNTHYTEW